MNAKLSTLLLLRVGVPAALLFGGLVWYSEARNYLRVVTQTENLARETARFHAAHFEAFLSSRSKITDMIARTLEVSPVGEPAPLPDAEREARLEAYLRMVVAENPEIYGSCIAFEPETFTPGKRFYAPYFYRKDNAPEFVQLGNPEYNYFNWEWYRLPKAADKALWSEPYFDEGGGNTVMTTYSVPFRRGGAFWGIATIDVAMDQLVAEADAIRIAKTGYAFLVSKQGRFLALPDKSKIMKVSVQDGNPELGRLMALGHEGFHRTKEPVGQREALIAYAPVLGGELSLAIVYPQAEVFAEALNLRKEQFAIGVLGLTALAAAFVLTTRSISRPITDLALAAQKVAQGDLNQRLNVNAPTEEIRRLTFAFNKMTRDLQTQMQELRYSTTVTERIEGELNAARSIQMSLLPKQFPAFPERREIDIHAAVRPAREVGGDLYDFYFLDDDWLCFLIGDVSGKGVPAALFMAVTKTLLKASSSRLGPLDRMFMKVNNELCEQTDTGMFVSLLCGRLHVPSGKLEICNAGHPSPFLLTTAGGVSLLEGAHSVALGAERDIEYTVTRTRLAAGEALFLYTDGVTEALSSGEHFYSPERLETLLREVATLPVEKITRRIIQDVRAFSGEHPQSDDISVLAVRWLGGATVASSPSREI